MMDKRIKDLWLKALRSKRYRKTLYMLQDKGCYCPLGVLADLYMKEKYPEETWEDSVDLYNILNRNSELSLRHQEVLPLPIAEWAGLQRNPTVFFEPVPGMGAKSSNIGLLNDSGYSFEEIADIVEREL